MLILPKSAVEDLKPVMDVEAEQYAWKNYLPPEPENYVEFGLLIPGKAYTTNKAFAGGRWSRKEGRDEVKKSAKKVIQAAMESVGDVFPVTGVHIVCQMQYSRQGNFCDTDAVAPMLKAVIDTMVTEGMLDDDTGENVVGVTYLPPVGQVVNEGLAVWVREVPAPLGLKG